MTCRSVCTAGRPWAPCHASVTLREMLGERSLGGCENTWIDVTFDAEFIFDTFSTRGDPYMGEPTHTPVPRSVTLLSRSVTADPDKIA